MVLDSIILDVAIGIIFIYLLLSLICTSFSELIAQILALRSNTLEEGIRNLLNDPDGEYLAKHFYTHPLIAGFIQNKQGRIDRWMKRSNKPSYIPSRTFAIALMDIITRKSETDLKPGPTDVDDETKKSTQESKTDPVRNFRDAVVENVKIQKDDTRRALLVLIDNSNNKLEEVQKNIEDWFNDAMDRVSGWFKRKMQFFVLIFAIVIVLSGNFDTIVIADNLATDSTLRDSFVESAGVFVFVNQSNNQSNNQSISSRSNTPLNETRDAIEELQMIQIGWSKEKLSRLWDPLPLLKKITGLIITIFAISLGAPFWFDVLSRLANLRGTGGKPEKPKS